MPPDVIVIGGGISGLTAAVDLSSCGCEVALLEQSEKLGGRAYSYRDRRTGELVDNGQHLMMGCFRHTKKFLGMIGTLGKLRIQKNLDVTFFHQRRGFVDFSCPNLPAPFHLLIALLRLKTLRLNERLGLLRVFRAIGKQNFEGADEENLSVNEWLTQLRQSEASKRFFWGVMATATLNQNPDVASASLFIKVLREAFFQDRDGSALMVPKTGLSELYVDDARKFVEDHKGRVECKAGVARILFGQRNVLGVELKDGRRMEARAVISSVPPFSLSAILPGNTGVFEYISKTSDEMEYSPILSINLWFDRVIMDEEFVSLLDSPIQWVFNKTKIFYDDRGEGTYLSCIVSGAEELVGWEKDELVKLAIRELLKPFPKIGRAVLKHAVVIKERRATLSSSPRIQRCRLAPRTSWENFFLAGDWTRTGLPATVEGAVASGFTAAKLAADYLGKNS